VPNLKMLSVGYRRDCSIAAEHRFAGHERIARELSTDLIAFATPPARKMSKFRFRGRTGRCHGS
jgi:hypothetical protein